MWISVYKKGLFSPFLYYITKAIWLCFYVCPSWAGFNEFVWRYSYDNRNISFGKVVIDGVSADWGMKQSEVEAAIGKGQLVGNRYYYFDSEMAIDYNDNNTVEFIEFLGGIDGSLQPHIYGVSAFGLPADDLVELLR